METATLPVETILAALKSPSELARACGRSRFWIIGKHNDGSLPFISIGRERKSTLEQLWQMLQADSAAERARLKISPTPIKKSEGERAARVAVAKKSLGIKG